MAGVVDGLRVLDLSRGAPGLMVTMLLADNGADVVRIEAPDAGRFALVAAMRVWNRAKRSLTLNLKNDGDRATALDLASRADVLVESFRPGVTERLGIDEQTLRRLNDRLVYCSITGYGRKTDLTNRPGYDQLVAARTGAQWDQRGYFGNRYDQLRGEHRAASDVSYDPGVEQTGNREGPVFSSVPWPSLGAAMLAISGISAALFVRERTGLGQLVETSLLQGVMMDKVMGWQRAEKPDQPGYRMWYFDRRGNKGLFQAEDGLWLHQWAPIEHELTRALAAGLAEGKGWSRAARAALATQQDALLHEIREYPATAAAFRTLPRDEWVRLYAEQGAPAQPVRSPEEALFDEPLHKERGIAEVADPELGSLRQAGVIMEFEKTPAPPIVRGAPRPGQDDPATILREWRMGEPGRSVAGALPRHPLEGVTVLDFGLAIAGPFGPQLMADLGAKVIKVNPKTENLSAGIHQGASRGKLSLAIDLKDPRGKKIAQELIGRSDVFHHNMRTGVVERLGIDYESAKQLNPRIIYCHTRGFEKDGPRTHLPGNDQMGNALAGTEYEMGGVHAGGKPIWPVNGFGDLGTGVISAAAVMLALRHRERTGQGQFIGGSILNTAMFYNSSTFAFPDGSGPERARVDAQQFGFDALHRLYETADGWLCIWVPGDAAWAALAGTLASGLERDGRFSDQGGRARHDKELSEALTGVFARKPAEEWSALLDSAGVPCEVSADSFPREALSDPHFREIGWTDSYVHPHLGRVDQPGNLLDFSLTPGRGYGPAPIIGQHTRQIVSELGYSEAEIGELEAAGVLTSANL